MSLFKTALLFMLIAGASLMLPAQTVKKVSVEMTTQALKDGKKFTHKADCYYSPEKGIYVTHHYKPEEFIKKTNRDGEMKIYYPEENKVTIQQDFYFSSENELLYYFINNLTEDLGLRREGFRMTKTKYEDDYMITKWKAPAEMKIIAEVELVFKDMAPVFSAYVNRKGDTLRKIYYSDYYQTTEFMLPRRITEISYQNENDSTVRRTIYSDIKLNDEVNPHYLNFEIPDNAKVVE